MRNKLTLSLALTACALVALAPAARAGGPSASNRAAPRGGYTLLTRAATGRFELLSGAHVVALSGGPHWLRTGGPLVRSINASLLRAGFFQLRAEPGPASRLELVQYIAHNPARGRLDSALGGLGGAHAPGSGLRSWSVGRNEAVMLVHASRDRVELVVVHYTPPRSHPTSLGRIATMLDRALHHDGFVRVSDHKLIAADGRLKDVRRYASPPSDCSRSFRLPHGLPDPYITTARGRAWGTVSWMARGGSVALHLDPSRCRRGGGWSAQLTILHAGQ